MIRILLAAAVCITCYACTRRCDGMPPPQAVYFHVVDNGLDLDSASLQWLEDGLLRREGAPFLELIYPAVRYDASRQPTVDSSRPVLKTYMLISTAVARRVNTFYIVYKNKERDTLIVHAEAEHIKNKGCNYTVQNLHAILYKGVLLSPNTSYISSRYPVYEIKRAQ